MIATCPPKRVQAIKSIRALTGLTLAPAKALHEDGGTAPILPEFTYEAARAHLYPLDGAHLTGAIVRPSYESARADIAAILDTLDDMDRTMLVTDLKNREDQRGT